MATFFNLLVPQYNLAILILFSGRRNNKQVPYVVYGFTFTFVFFVITVSYILNINNINNMQQ